MKIRAIEFIVGLSWFFFLFASSPAESIFAIGNSLTWDTRPSLLDGDVQWHVTCNRNLAYIFSHPRDVCIESSTSWDVAVQNKDYDYIVMQPFSGTTLTKDAEVVSVMMNREPNATFVVHTAWPSIDNLQQVYTSEFHNDLMRPSAVYFANLVAEIRENHPGRRIESDHVVDVLYSIAVDIDHHNAPFDSIRDLYRDSAHLSEDYGRYVAHNGLRLAIDQPLSSIGFDISPAIKQYLDSKLVAAHNGTLFASAKSLIAASSNVLPALPTWNLPVSSKTEAASLKVEIFHSNLDAALNASGSIPAITSSAVPEPTLGLLGVMGILSGLNLSGRQHREK